MGGGGGAAHTGNRRAPLSILNAMNIQCILTGTSYNVASSLNDLKKARLRQGVSAM